LTFQAGIIEPDATGAVAGWPRFWLKVEGLGAFIAGATAFNLLGGSPLVFVIALLAVDVSMVGYLRSPRWGAVTYNLAHNWFTGLAVLGLGYGTGTPGLVLAGCVLIAHVGGDRLAGYGLKYPSSFGDTHLGWIGRRG
jgi:hypothetical protein